MFSVPEIYYKIFGLHHKLMTSKVKRFTNLLRYVGGKSKAIKALYTYFPVFNVYIEPMCGGASIFFYIIITRRERLKRIIINDIDKNLIDFYISVRDNVDELINVVSKKVKDLQVGNKDNMNLLRLFLDDRIENAANYYIRNRISFSGMTYKHAYSMDAHIKFLNSKYDQKLRYASELMQGVEIYNKDYSEVLSEQDINDYDNIFVFLDPPYYSNKNNKLYGLDGRIHLNFDHERLRNFMHDHIERFKFLITYDKDDYIMNLYKDFCEIDTYNLQYCMQSNKEGKSKMVLEYAIYNYKKPGTLF
ncbi:MAG: hypothetical protein QXF12_00270 [Candidatus Aenigmatarchaeota archaeon]